MLDFVGTLREVSDMSHLYNHELYLETTRCLQFTIDTSLPWMLIEHVITDKCKELPVIENIFYILDIFNDAAYKALYVLEQQHLYDEVEAEASVIFDQIVVLLTEEMYGHYKNLSAYEILDEDTKRKLQLHDILKKDMHVYKRRFELVCSQHSIQLLGRSIDLNFLIGQYANNIMLKDLETAFARYYACFLLY